MADNEASIGLRAYLIDQISEGMSIITDSLTAFKSTAESMGQTAADSLSRTATVEQELAQATEAASSTIKDQEEASSGLSSQLELVIESITSFEDAEQSLSGITEELQSRLDAAEANVKNLRSAAEELEASYNSLDLTLEESIAADDAITEATLNLYDAQRKYNDLLEEAGIAQEKNTQEIDQFGFAIETATTDEEDLSKSVKDVVESIVTQGEALDKTSSILLEFQQKTQDLNLSKQQFNALADSVEALHTTFESGTKDIDTFTEALDHSLSVAQMYSAENDAIAASEQSEIDIKAALAQTTLDAAESTKILSQSDEVLAGSAQTLAEQQDVVVKATETMSLAISQVDMTGTSFDTLTSAMDRLIEDFTTGTTDAATFSQGVQNLAQAALDTAAAEDDLALKEKEAADAQANANPEKNGMNFGLMMLQQYAQQASTSVDNMAKSVITSAGDQEEAFTRLQNVLGISDKSFASLSSFIISTANTSTFSSEQIAQSFTYAAEKGYTAGDLIKSGMGQSLINLAEATNTDVVPATDLLITTMRTFGASADEAKNYSDMLTYAFQNGIPDISQLQQAIIQVGGSASSLGLPFDQVAASLDWLAKNGLPNASMAGASLKYMLDGLSSPTSKAADELQHLGIITLHSNGQVQDFVAKLNAASKTQYSFSGTLQNLSDIYNQAQKLGTTDFKGTFMEWAMSVGALGDKLTGSDGKLKSIPGTIHQIIDAVKKLPKSEQIPSIGNLFNVRSGEAAKLLAGDPNSIKSLEQGVAGVDNSTKGKGAAATQADKLQQDFNTKMGELKTSWQSFVAQVGMPIITFLKPIIDDANKLVGALQKGHSSWLLFGAVLLMILAIVMPIAAFIIGIVIVMSLLGAAVAPVVIIIAVVALAVAVGAALIITHWKQVSTFFSAAAGWINTAIGNIGKWFQSLFASIGGWIQSGLSTAKNIVSSTMGGIQTAFKASVDFIGNIFKSIGTLLKPVTDAVSKTLGPSFKTAGDEIKHATSTMSAAVVPVFHTVSQAFTSLSGPASTVAHYVGGQLSGAFKLLASWGTPIMGILKGIGSVLVTAGQGVLSFGKFIGSLALPFLIFSLTTLWNILKFVGLVIATIVVVALGILVGIINGVIKAIGSIVTMLVNVAGAFITFVQGILTVFAGLWQLLLGLVTFNGATISKAFNTIWTGIQLMFAGMVGIVVSIFTGLLSMVMNLFTGFLGGMFGFFGRMINTVNKGAGDAMASFGDAVSSGIAGALSWFNALPGRIVGVLSGLGPMLSQSAQNAIQMFINGILGGLGGVKDAVGQIASSVTGFLGFHSPPKAGPLADSDQYMPNMMKMYGSGITANKHHVLNALGDVAAGMHGSLTSPSIARMQASYGANSTNQSHTINLNIDGKQVTSVVMDNLTGQLKMNGMGRAWR